MRHEPREVDVKEVDVLLKECCEVLNRMKATDSMRPVPILEKHFRPVVELALLRVRVSEAERCDAYGKIGSPRVLQLKAELNDKELQVAALRGQRFSDSA